MQLETIMKRISYTRHWENQPAEEREGDLVALLLDTPFAFISVSLTTSLIPPFRVMNELLKSGGDDGGLSAGATWQPFEIDQVTYTSLVDRLSIMDLPSKREDHPLAPRNLIVDRELNHDFPEPEAWRKQVYLDYVGVTEFNEFYAGEQPQLFLGNELLGEVHVLSVLHGPSYFGEIALSPGHKDDLNLKSIWAWRNPLLKRWKKQYGKEYHWAWQLAVPDKCELYVKDSWGRTTRLLEVYFGQKDAIVFCTKFVPILPKKKV